MKSKALQLANPRSKTAAIYREIAPKIPDDAKGTELVRIGYDLYSSGTDRNQQSNRPISGNVFEYLVIDALFKHHISPIYYQAEITNIPDIKYDILLYHPVYPVVISCKTSLGERWKQADLEGGALKQVYRGALSYLVTMPKISRDGKVTHEGLNIQRKIEAKTAVGLDQSIEIDPEFTNFDRLLDKLAGMTFTQASHVMPVTGRVLE